MNPSTGNEYRVCYFLFYSGASKWPEAIKSPFLYWRAPKYNNVTVTIGERSRMLLKNCMCPPKRISLAPALLLNIISMFSYILLGSLNTVLCLWFLYKH